MIQVTKGGQRATVEDDLSVSASDTLFKMNIEMAIINVQQTNDLQLPDELILYYDLKDNGYSVSINKEYLSSLRGDNAPDGAIF